MRLIGIKLGSCDPLVRKTLRDNEWYPFGNYQEPTNENGWRWRTKEQEEQEEACRMMYKVVMPEEDTNERLDITVNCIVGMNGSGKSTLLDLLYRIINNFSWKLIDQVWFDNRPENNPQRGHQLVEAKGFDATLFYETDGFVGSLRYYYGRFEMNYYSDAEDAKVVGERFLKLASKTKMERLTRHFFYTICMNYSLHSLNQRDYTPNRLWLDLNHDINGKWIQGLFHKNDGYVTPIVMVPYRTEDDYIDIDNENDLAKQRLATLAILFGSQGKSFLNVYEPQEIVYRFDNEAAVRYGNKFNRLYRERLPLNKECSKLKTETRRVWNRTLRTHCQGFARQPKMVREAVLSYLTYKTLKTCLQYRNYGLKLGVRSLTEKERLLLKKGAFGYVLDYDPKRVAEVVEGIMFQDPDIHTNLKIHQMLEFLNRRHYATDNLTVPEGTPENPKRLMEFGWSKKPVAQLYELNKGENDGRRKPFKTFDEVSRVMPPAIFEWDINFSKTDDDKKEKETLTQMSSGERQMMHSVSYIIYHLKNLQSVTEGDYRIRYHNVCMVFDEAELYYHPEYQRKFISNLIEMLSWSHINPNIIRGINILIATHSPFVLSDVPLANTLYLKEGRRVRNEKETFCGNVHEMLGGNFFLEYSIGDVARKNVEEIIWLYNQRNDKSLSEQNKMQFRKHYDRYRYVARHIADEYLRRKVDEMMDELDDMYDDGQPLDDKIKAAQRRLDELLEKKNKQDDKGWL